MGLPFVVQGLGGLGLIAGGLAVKNRVQKDAASAEAAQKRADQEAANFSAQSEQQRSQFSAIPDLAAANQSPFAFAELRRQMARNSRASSFLTGPGGGLANRSLLTQGMTDFARPQTLLTPQQRAAQAGF